MTVTPIPVEAGNEFTIASFNMERFYNDKSDADNPGSVGGGGDDGGVSAAADEGFAGDPECAELCRTSSECRRLRIWRC